MKENQLKKNEAGFSLIELLIVAIILSLFTATVFTLLNSSLKISATTNQMADTQQNLRTSQEYISRDLYNTAEGLKYFFPKVNRNFLLNYLSRDAVSSDTFLPGGMIISDDNVSNVDIQNPITPGLKLLNGTDRITMLVVPDFDGKFDDINSYNIGTVSTPQYRGAGNSEMHVLNADAARLRVGEIYMIINPNSSGANFGTAFVTVTDIVPRPGFNYSTVKFGTGGSAGDYGLNSGVIEALTENSNRNPMTLKRVWMVHYYVDENKRLMRRVFGQADTARGLPFTDSVIAESVKDLQFRYILRKVDTNGEILLPETVDVFRNESDQLSVRQVEIRVTTETVKPLQNGQRQEIQSVTITSPRNLQFNINLM